MSGARVLSAALSFSLYSPRGLPYEPAGFFLRAHAKSGLDPRSQRVKPEFFVIFRRTCARFNRDRTAWI